MLDLTSFKDSLLKQSITCGETSELYKDIFIILSESSKCFEIFDKVNKIRTFQGGIELSLLFSAFFHYIALTDVDSPIRKYFRTYSGVYSKSNFSDLKTIIENILLKEEDTILRWILNTKLQTNEVNRCSVVYPLILSLGLNNINLIELGCSAGLILLMDLYNYTYIYNGVDEISFNKDSKTNINSNINTPERLISIIKNKEYLKIVKKIGIDLNILDINYINNQNLLKSSIWDDPIREKRLSDAIDTFKVNSSNISLLSMDYTNDLYNSIFPIIDKDSDLVFFSSVSTYQINRDLYEKLLFQLELISNSLGKKIYFLEFEGKRVNEIIDIELTEIEPFYLSVTTFPNREKNFMGRAHFHGRSFTIF